MTGKKMLETAVNMLGYRAANGNLQLNSRVISKGLTLLNLIYGDLWRICFDGEFCPLEKMQDKILLPDRALNDIMPYGVAMLIAQSESDGDQQQLYATLYNRKRTGLSNKDSIKDIMPRGEY